MTFTDKHRLQKPASLLSFMNISNFRTFLGVKKRTPEVKSDLQELLMRLDMVREGKYKSLCCLLGMFLFTFENLKYMYFFSQFLSQHNTHTLYFNNIYSYYPLLSPHIKPILLRKVSSLSALILIFVLCGI